MFRTAHRSSSGALNCVCSLWFIHPCGDRPLPRLSGRVAADPRLSVGLVMDKISHGTQPWQLPVTTSVYKPEAADTI
jgi:hypothetical protein